MQLNKKGREELRLLVEKELKNIPEGTRIKLENDILELLLFEKIAYRRNPDLFVKLPIWSGSFLRKLDLGSVSFEDVSWSLLEDTKDSTLGEEAFDEECWKSFLIEYGDKPKKRVDYSKTNISLDFNISWEMKARKLLEQEIGVYISNCDFSYVDLSTIDTSYFRKIKKSNFSHTNLVLPSSLGNIQSPIFTYTDLTGNNLEGITIKLIDIVTTGGSLIGLGCNLAGTRISLILDGSAFQNKQVQDNLRTILASGDLDGCLINDKIVFSREEKQERAQHKLQEYEEFKQKKFSEISKLIQSQAKPK